MAKSMLFYAMDTTRNNAQTLYCLKNGIIPRLCDSYEFGMGLCKGLIMPLIEMRPIDGLRLCTLRQIAMALGRDPVAVPAPVVPDSMENFPKLAEKRGKCKMCKNILPGTQDYHKAKDNISRMAQQCGRCGNTTCNDHMLQLCRDCASKYSLQNRGRQ